MTIVRCEWTRRQGDADTAYAAIQRKLSNARQRKDKLVDLRIDGHMDQATYLEQNE